MDPDNVPGFMTMKVQIIYQVFPARPQKCSKYDVYTDVMELLKIAPLF